jgi:hypothetical protein
LNAVVLFLGLIALSPGCAPGGGGGGDPKRRLTDYISKTFSVRAIEDRKVLAAFMVGEARNRLEAWSDEQFRQVFLDSKRQFVKLVIREIKAIAPDETGITYELTYLDQNRGKDAKVTNKKLATLVLDRERWMIREVQNIKETVEYRNEMALP